MHCITHYIHFLHQQSCQGRLVLEYSLPVLDCKVVLGHQVQRLKRLQARFEVLLRPHLNPWTCASLGFRQFTPLLSCSSFLLFLKFLDPVTVSSLVLVMTLIGRSRDFVDPRLLKLHLSPQLPKSGSAVLQKEVQQVVAAGWYAKMNVEVPAHAI